jgi:replicative DNA helicase
MEIDYISGMYKQMAKDNNCVVLILSQFNRPDKAARKHRPTMASLKESSALEHDGDLIMILHRPYVLEKDNPDITPEDGYILIDKNKFGRTGRVDLRFDGRYQRFFEVDKATARLEKKFKTSERFRDKGDTAPFDETDGDNPFLDVEKPKKG